MINLGLLVATELVGKADRVEANPPSLRQFDPFGRRIDELIVAQEWKDMHAVAATEGLIAIGYERRFREFSRIYQAAKLLLFSPSSALYSCPLAMTDGAARLIELLCSSQATSGSDIQLVLPHLRDAMAHLTSRDANNFWTSGQWMTERAGGSDVGDGTHTIARLQADGSYKLYGFKWFTSATDAAITFTLARIEGPHGVVPGSKGLSCFFLKVRNSQGELNGIKIARLKSKLGTKQLPTAELELSGATAWRVSEIGRGVVAITSLINITRIHNAISACSGMRRACALAGDYASKRVAFGKALVDHQLHMETLSDMATEYRAGLAFTLDVTARLGRVETGPHTGQKNDSALLRLLVPIVKLFTAKQAVRVASEALESFGGAGYCEDTGPCAYVELS